MRKPRASSDIVWYRHASDNVVGFLNQAFDSARYAVGASDELKGTGVFSFIKASRKTKEAEAAKQKPPPQKKPDGPNN
eukprot:6342760-Pyramimonas_sp.AAC.1